MFGALLDCDNDALALSAVGPQGSEVSWSYSSISRHCCTVAGALNASLRASSTAHTSAEAGQRANGDGQSRRHVVICGSMAFQAIMAVACYRQRYVGVFVPMNTEDTLSSISVIQRASEAFAVVVDDATWSSLQPQIQSRSNELQDCTVLVYGPGSGKISQLQQPSTSHSGKVSAASLLPAPVDESLPEPGAAPSPTAPLYIFHRKDKHTTVTLDHSTVQSYMHQGITSLTHAVDHRQVAPAPAPVDARLRIRSYTQLACDAAAAAAEHSGSIRASTNRSTSCCLRQDGVQLSGIASTSQCSSAGTAVLPFPTSTSLSKCTCSNAAEQADLSSADQVIPASTCVMCTSCTSAADPGSFASNLSSRCCSAGLSSDSCLSVAPEVAPHLPQPPSHDMLIEQLLARINLDDVISTHQQDDVIQTQQHPAVAPMLKPSEPLSPPRSLSPACKPDAPPSTCGRAISTAIPTEVYSDIAVPSWSAGLQRDSNDANADACIDSEPCTVTRAQPPAEAIPRGTGNRPTPLTVHFDIPAEPSWASHGFCTPPRNSTCATPAPATPEPTPSSEINFGLCAEWCRGEDIELPTPASPAVVRTPDACPSSSAPGVSVEGVEVVPLWEHEAAQSVREEPCGGCHTALDRLVLSLEPGDSDGEEQEHWGLAALSPEVAMREIGLCPDAEPPALYRKGSGGESVEEAQSLAWKTGAWSDSAKEEDGAVLSDVRSTIESWQSGISGACCTGGRQPRLLSALPPDTPAALLFGLLLPLSMGWHVALPQQEGRCGDVVWKELFRDPAQTFAAVFMPSACCDELTRLAIEALGGKAPSECVQGATALGAPLAALSACALFGPAVTPGTVQSFVASMQPFGLRRSAISVVCSTWELPVLCAPLLGLHTLETGVRCAVGDAASPLGTVVVVGGTSRTELPDGNIGNIWVYAGGAASPKTRGISAMPLQWLFDPSTHVRSGPYHATGLAGYVENGRVFIIGRYADIMFAQDSSQHATDIEAALLGNTPSFNINGFALRMPAAKGSVCTLPMLPGTLVPARGASSGKGIRTGGKGTSACNRPRGSMERGTFWPRLKLSRKTMGSRGEGAVERGPCIKALGAEGGLRGQAGGGGEAQDRCAVLMVRRHRRRRRRGLRPLKIFQACVCGTNVNGRKHGLKQDEILDSLAMIKLAWGVHVKEVWAMDSELPVTPMGNVDRSAASAFTGRVDVFDVDERHGVLRARVGGHEAKA